MLHAQDKIVDVHIWWFKIVDWKVVTHSVWTTMQFTHFASWEKNHITCSQSCFIELPTVQFYVHCVQSKQKGAQQRVPIQVIYTVVCVGKSEKQLYVSHRCRRGNLALLHVVVSHIVAPSWTGITQRSPLCSQNACLQSSHQWVHSNRTPWRPVFNL